MTTFQDIIDHLVDYVGDRGSDAVGRDCKRAALEAYRDLTNAHRWSYLYTHGRVIMNPPFMDGTVAYTHTGGQYERMFTLTGGMWPAYTAGSYVRIGCVNYKIVAQPSATIALADELVNPGANIASLTAYELYRDTYLLPLDYAAQDQAIYENNFGGMCFVHPREWLYQERHGFASGTPRIYTITGDPVYPGRLVLKVAPWPVLGLSIDFLYHRRPRPLAIPLEKWGSASIVAGSTALTGVGTFFTPSMVGSAIRVSDSSKLPTSVIDSYPAMLETRISGWVDATHVTVADPSPATVSGVSLTVSDVVDIEEGAMLNAYLRCCEKCIAQSRTLKDKPSAQAQYQKQLNEARSADSRSFAGRHAGPIGRMRPHLRDFPSGPDDIN